MSDGPTKAFVPGFGTSVAAHVRLGMVRTVRGRKLRLGIVATVLVVVAAVASRYLADEADPADVVKTAVQLGFFWMLAFLLPFLFASGAIAEEVENRTMTFLAIRPAGRLALTLGKLVVAWVFSAGLLVLGVIVLHIGAYATEPSDMIDEMSTSARSAGALALLAFCYCAICLFWGALVVEASGLVSTLHLAAVEFVFGFLPGVARFMSMNYFCQQLAGLPQAGFGLDWVPELSLGVCGAIVAVVSLVFVALSTLVVETSEVGFGRA
jgi:ABC-type transport system involved in multi-copper enzyme maturation permease subunit